jgi:outer membrane protein TolC
MPRAEQARDVSVADYRTGRTDILQVIDNYRALLTFQIQLARFDADLGQSLASLDRVVGCEVSTASAGAAVPPAPTPADGGGESVDDASAAGPPASENG